MSQPTTHGANEMSTSAVEQKRPINLAPIVAIGVIVAALFGGYYALNYIPADTAKAECLRLANDNLKKRLYEEVKVMDTWTKSGKRVVELGYFENQNDKSYMPRICVVGGGKVQIVSAFENWMWR
jgi:hypothetical protein